MKEPKEQNTLQADARPAAKKAYRKPEFQFERVFETRALSCGKIAPTESQCELNLKNS